MYHILAQIDTAISSPSAYLLGGGGFVGLCWVLSRLFGSRERNLWDRVTQMELNHTKEMAEIKREHQVEVAKNQTQIETNFKEIEKLRASKHKDITELQLHRFVIGMLWGELNEIGMKTNTKLKYRDLQDVILEAQKIWGEGEKENERVKVHISEQH